MFGRQVQVNPAMTARRMRQRVASMQQEREKPARRRGMVRGLMAGVVVGAAGMFMFDPRTGRRRRALVRDKVVHIGHSVDDLVTETIPKKAEYLSGFARGLTHQAGEAIGTTNGQVELEDHTITDRVMSMVFRDPDVPKGDVNVDTVDRVVYLRGAVEDQSLVATIEERVRNVEGVRDVINLINRPEADPTEIRADMEST